MNGNCIHCGSKTNLYGDCIAKCKGWFKDNDWRNFIRKNNPFLKVLKKKAKKITYA